MAGQAEAAVATPGNVVAASHSMGLAVNVTWAGDPAARSYVVHRGPTATFTPSAATVLGRVTKARYVDDAATAGRTLFYRIVAVDAVGLSSAPSTAASVSSPDGMAEHRSKAATWLTGQQEQSQGFRMTFDANYQGFDYWGPIGGRIADIDQIPGAVTKNPWIGFAQDYPTGYTGPVNGRWANITSPERYEVRVYAYPEGDIEYRQDDEGFPLNADGTWSSGAVAVNLGAKTARVVLRDAVEPAWPERVEHVAATDSDLPAESLDAVEVQVFYRSDIDYLQDTVAVSSDGTWIDRFTRSTKGHSVIARLVNKATQRTLSSTEWAADASYQGLVRSFHIPFDDPAYGYEGDFTQRTGYRLEQRSWMYDDAVAALAYLSNNQPERARAVLANLSQVQQPDGSFPFSADVYRGQIYEVYVRTGALAWVATAALAYEDRTGDPSFRYLAKRTADYLLTLQVTDPADPKYGAVRGGWGRYDENYDFIEGYVGFAGTEHNIDSYFVLRDIGYTTGEQRYLDAAELVKQALLTKFWNPTEKRFNQGIDDPAKALDAGSWGGLFLSAIGREDMARDSLAFSEQFRVEDAAVDKCSEAECYNQSYSSAGPIDGYRPYLETTGNYPGAPATVWAEGTWGQLLLRLRLGEDITGDLQSMQRLQDADPRGGYLQVTRGAASMPYEFHAWPAVGGTGWAAMVMTDPSFFWMPDKWVYDRPEGFGAKPAPVTEPASYGCQCLGTDPATVSALRGDPVNTATGALTMTVADLKLTGRGVPFELNRSYTSADTRAGPLGAGWTHSLDESLTTDPATGDVTARTSSGGQLVYIKQKDGTYLPPPGAPGNLKPAAGGFELTLDSDGVVHAYDTSGRLVRVSDRLGHGLRLAYAAGHLSTVTDDAGRIVTLTMTGDRITKVTLPDDRAVSYAYTSGRLTSVTDTRGGVTRFTYDADGRLSESSDPLGRQVVTEYDAASGRVTRQTDATGQVASYAWDPTTTTSTMTDPRGGKWIDVYSANVRTATTDPLGNTTRYRYDGDLNVTAIDDARGNTTTLAYDARGNVTRRTGPAPSSYTDSVTYSALGAAERTTDRRGGITINGYDADGRLLSVTDAAGGVTRYTYTAADQVATRTDPRGKTTAFEYDAAGNLTASTSPTGKKQLRGYDGSGRLISRTDPRGTATGATAALYTWNFEYDAADNLIAEIPPPLVAGGTREATRYGYDAVGNATTVTDAAGRVTTTGYDGNNRPVTVTEPADRITRYTYDATGNRTSIITPTGAKTTFTFDLAGRRITETSPRGNATGAIPADFTWTYGYDAAGNQTTARHPLTGVTTTTFDELNRPTTETDGLGRTRRWTFDGNNNTLTQTDPTGAVTRFAYDAEDRLTTVTSPRGNATRHGYDAAGNRTSTTTALNAVTSWAYDDDGRVVSETDPRGNTTGATASQYTQIYAYDAAGQPTTTTDALGNATNLAWDGRGRLTARTDALGRSTRHAYDVLDRLTTLTAPDTTTTKYAYDAAGDLTSRTDAKNRVTTYTYDTEHRLAGTTNPASKRTNYTYDLEGNLLTTIKPSGNATTTAGDGTITRSYDSLGRLTKTDYSDTTPDVTYTVDKGGRLTTMTDGTGTETYSYDGADRLTAINRTGANLNFTYDADGNQITRAYPDGVTATSVYDAESRRTADTVGSTTTQFTYDGAGRLLTTALPGANGHVETHTYDRAGQLTRTATSKGTTTLSASALTLDKVGNPTVVATTRGTTTTNDAYTYDNLNRLTKVCVGTTTCTGAATTTTYAYDAVGNRTSEARLASGATTTTTHTYDTIDQLTNSVTGTTTTASTYDADGNQLTNGTTSYAYTLGGLTKSATAAGVTTTYAYDGHDRRVSTSTGTAVTKTAWDPTTAGVAQPATEKDNAGTTLRRYANGPAGPYGYSAGTAGWQYLNHDALGSVSDVTNATGAAQWRYAYEPFGGLRSETKVVSTAPINTLKYDSQYHDANTGLYHLRARQYDPRLGRFTAQDPVSPSRSDPYVSAYAYANNQPTVLADPTGLTPSWGDIGIGAVSVVDKLSMGTAPWVRAQLGAGDFIDICSPAYTSRWTDGVALAVEIGTLRPWGLLRAAKMADEVATASVGAGLSAKAGGGGSTSIYRAVSTAEADDIAAHGFRQAPDGRSFEGKLFATSPEDAARFGRINYGLDRTPFHVVEARVPTTYVNDLYSGTADRMPFIGVNPDQLAGLNRVADVQMRNSVPWVPKP